MAKCDMKMPEDFLLKISKLGSNFDSVADTVLQAGGEVVLKRVKSNLSSVIGRGTKYDSRSTGELEGALGLSPSKLNRDGNHDIKVGFAEPRSDGGSNAKLANILEYGKHGQPAKPFLKPAKTASRQECIDAMTKALDEEVEKLGACYPIYKPLPKAAACLWKRVCSPAKPRTPIWSSRRCRTALSSTPTTPQAAKRRRHGCPSSQRAATPN